MPQHRSRFEDDADEKLAQMARDGDFDAFDELARRFRPGVVLAAERILGGRASAEDVAQDALLLAFKNLSHLKQVDRFAGWLYAIARNRAKRVAASPDYAANSMDDGCLDQIASLYALRRISVEDELCDRHDYESLQRAMGNLAPEVADVLRLRYWDEWPTARIAEFFRLPQTTISWRLHSGRRQLRQLLLRYRDMDT